MKVRVHDTTYIFLLLSFLSGYFEYIFILLLIIFIHESGHYFFSVIMNLNVKEIILYPLGGITIIDSDLNIEIYKELICLLGGIIFQLLFYLMIVILYKNNLITFHIYNLINKINFILLSFNFMPIIPLDGGKLLNLILDIYIPYLNSLKISLIVSIIFSIIFLCLFHTIYSIILFLFLLKSIYEEYINIKIKYNLFLYERYINNYNYKKIKFIIDIYHMYRNKYHFINNINEKEVLNGIFNN